MNKTKTITLYSEGNSPRKKIKKSNIKIQLDEKKISVSGIPEDATLEYLAKSKEDNYFLVYSSTINRDYNNFKLYMGKENALVEAKVKDVNRLRDGGTTNISYIIDGKERKLYFPTPFRPDVFPSDSHEGMLEDLLKKYS